MDDMMADSGDEAWVIWNGELGLVTTAALGCVEVGATGRMGWLDEPFDMVGPFDLDALEAEGRIAFEACIVMSRQRWREDQAALRVESIALRRAAQQRMEAEFARYFGRRNADQRKGYPVDEREHRAALNLPMEGKLEKKQINAAFRRLAQKAHPDAGGTSEQFVRITQARTVLLETVV